MQKVISLIISVVILSSVSCTRKMNATEYVKYVTSKDAGLRKISLIDGWEFCMQYKPYDYIMLMESRGQKQEHNSDKRKSELSGTAWFNISIKRQDNSVSPLRYGLSSIEEYNDRLNYYLNNAEKDIKLVYDKDTLAPMSYVFENNYNLTPQETIVVGFALPQGVVYPQKNMRLSFIDHVFKNGIINAEYTSKTLKDIPTLTY